MKEMSRGPDEIASVIAARGMAEPSLMGAT
jgi:hypothetical protein